MDIEFKNIEEKMEKTLQSLENEYKTMKVGRANPHILDRVRVDYYGTPSQISQVANIAVPEAKVMEIKPWDASVLKDIEKAIIEANLGINPNNDGKIIRLVFPALTEEKRKELSKDVKNEAENSKVAVRNLRRDAIDKYKKLEKDGEITEDILKSYEKKIQDITDKNISKIDAMVDEKISEIMSI